MNKFDRKISLKKTPKGLFSQAAKQAFEDMRKDKSMWVKSEIFGMEYPQPIILSENILEIDNDPIV